MLGINTVLGPGIDVDDPPIETDVVVVHIDPPTNRLFAVELSGECRTVHRWPLGAVMSWIEGEKTSCWELEIPEWMLLHDGAYTPAERRTRDRRWEMIRPIVRNHLDEFLLGSYGEHLVADRARAFDRSRITVYRTLNRYFRYGQIINSLLPDYRKCGRGSPGKDAKKVGARPQDGSVGRNVTDEDRENIKPIVKRHIATGKYTVRAAFELVFNAKHQQSKRATKSPEGETKTKLKPVDEMITEGQFRRVVNGVFAEMGITSTHIGRSKAEYAKDFGARSGDAMRPEGPGHVFQLDSTPADIEVASQFHVESSVLVGRPTIYQVIDAYSTVTVGIYVCLGDASWGNARLAVYTAIRKKDKDYYDELGMEMPDESPLSNGPPQILFVDNLEIASRLAEVLERDCNIIVQYGRARRGDDKGEVEFQLGEINRELKHLPGYITKDVGRSGRADPKATASITLPQLHRHLVDVVHQRNHHRVLPSDHLTDTMIRDGVEPTPMAIWNWGIRHRPWLGRARENRQLMLMLLEVGEATVKRKGIQFRGCLYTCEEVRRRGMQDRKPKRHRSIRLEVRFMRHSTKYILLILPDGTSAWAFLEKRSARFERCSFDEVEIRLREEHVQKKQLKRKENETAIDVHISGQEMARQAAEGKEKLSKSDVRAQQIQEQRREELGHEVLAQRDEYERAVEDEVAEDGGTEPEDDSEQEPAQEAGDSGRSALLDAMSDDLDEDDYE